MVGRVGPRDIVFHLAAMGDPCELLEDLPSYTSQDRTCWVFAGLLAAGDHDATGGGSTQVIPASATARFCLIEAKY